MVKVGILTFHWSNHVGAVLQAYALGKAIKYLGHEVCLVNFHPNLELMVSTMIRPDKLVMKYKALDIPFWKRVKSMQGEVIYYLLSMVSEIKRAKSFEFFRKKYLRIEPKEKIIDLDCLRHECSNYAAIIVGSDQVWNPKFLEYSNYAYLLPFKLTDTLKIGFSASVGVEISSIPKELLVLYRKTLEDFAFISVREYQHAREFSKILNREVYHTLDPTLLVSKEAFEEITYRYPKLLSENYVFFYNLDPSILPYTEILEKLLNLPVIIYKKPTIIRERKLYEKWLRNKTSFYYVGPQEFIVILRNAELVFTNSYHGLILSILFEIPVIVTTQGLAFETKSRIEDLVRLLGLHNRLVKDISDVAIALHKDVDYRDVDSKLRELRKKSMDLLKEALKTL